MVIIIFKISFCNQIQVALRAKFPVFCAQKLVVRSTHHRKQAKFYAHPAWTLHKFVCTFCVAELKVYSLLIYVEFNSTFGLR
jgi:hypothetical protein